MSNEQRQDDQEKEKMMGVQVKIVLRMRMHTTPIRTRIIQLS